MKKLLLSIVMIGATYLQAGAQDKYTNVKVTAVKITNAPMEQINGTRFDSDWYPDYYVTFSVKNETWYTSNYYEQCSKFPITLDFVRPFKIENLDIPYTLTIMDYDKYADDEVVQLFKNIVFADYKDYPSQITLKYQDRAEVVLSLKWY